MSTTASSEKDSFVADSLMVGVSVMLLMTVVQRAVGFARGVWLCRVLDDAVVGQWSMVYDFIVMAAPIALLGMPGALPRYVEHYRSGGHVRALVGRLLMATTLLALLFGGVMCAAPGWFGWLILLDAHAVSMVHAICCAVMAIVFFNFVNELVASLRQVRMVSCMQFIQSVGFTLLAIGALLLGGGLATLIHAFTAATLLAMAPGVWVLRRGWSGLPRASQPLRATTMWRRVLPFAITLWSMNLMFNAFAMSDRYMILHWLPAGVMDPSEAVGQYHSGRLFPILLVSVAAMVAGVLLPYLSADWEMGRQTQVRLRMRQILFAVSVVFTLGAASVLFVSPWIFQHLLENRYEIGLTLMPMTFVFCIWIALATIGENYLWVCERGKLAAMAMAIGLVINLLLNYLLLPVWGLHGALWATLLANLVVLVGMYLGMARHGYGLDRTSLYSILLPATLLAGPWAAILSVVACLSVNPQAQDWGWESWRNFSRKLSPRGDT